MQITNEKERRGLLDDECMRSGEGCCTAWAMALFGGGVRVLAAAFVGCVLVAWANTAAVASALLQLQQGGAPAAGLVGGLRKQAAHVEEPEYVSRAPPESRPADLLSNSQQSCAIIEP